MRFMWHMRSLSIWYILNKIQVLHVQWCVCTAIILTIDYVCIKWTSKPMNHREFFSGNYVPQELHILSTHSVFACSVWFPQLTTIMLPQTALTGWSVSWRRDVCVFPVRYRLNVCYLFKIYNKKARRMPWRQTFCLQAMPQEP
jgi:hypothetical protein